MLTSCQQAKERYDELLELKERFDSAYEKAVKTGEMDEARALKAEITEKKETLLNMLDTLAEVLKSMEAPSLKEQYETQKSSFEELGVLETLASGELGIKGEDSTEYPFPTYEEVRKMARENKEMLKAKAEQGFTRLQMTPFALPINSFAEHPRSLILKKHKEGKLLGVDGEPLVLDENHPLFLDNEYSDLRYLPKWRTEGNEAVAEGGFTKEEMIAKYGGWQMTFTESFAVTPNEGEGEPIGGRAQIEGGMLASEQYEKFGSPPYEHESGYTPEEWLTHFMLHLKEKDKVLDDDESTWRYARLLGARFAASGRVPNGSWFRDLRQAHVGRDGPEISDPEDGCRASVRMGRL